MAKNCEVVQDLYGKGQVLFQKTNQPIRLNVDVQTGNVVDQTDRLCLSLLSQFMNLGSPAAWSSGTMRLHLVDGSFGTVFSSLIVAETVATRWNTL